MDECMQRLEELPLSELPKIFWSLLEDKWPEELGEKPAWVGDEERTILARWIQDRIGVKACYRYMCTAFNGMTDQMFDDYWDSCEELRQQRTNASQDRTNGKKYANNGVVYANFIKDAKRYAEPKELQEFRRPCISPEFPYCPDCPVGGEYISESELESLAMDGECRTEWYCNNVLKRPPQSWCYVEERYDRS